MSAGTGSNWADLRNQTVDAQIGWDRGDPGFSRLPGAEQSKITVFRVVRGRGERLSVVLDRASRLPPFLPGDWVRTSDGEGEVVDYDPEADRPYYVLLDIPGADASADNVLQYPASALSAAPPPRWKVLRDRESR